MLWPTDLSALNLMTSNVVLCGGPAAMTVEVARGWRPVRSSYGLDRSRRRA